MPNCTLEQYCSAAISDAQWSPDIPYLTRKFSYVPVFVYNQHRSGMAEHGLLEQSNFIGRGKTVNGTWKVFFSDENEPIAIETPSEASGLCHLQGEIYQVPPPVLFKMDIAMCNGVHFRRRPEVIRGMTSKNTTTEFLSQCWVYGGIATNLATFIEKFTPAPIISGNEPTFLYNMIHDVKYRQKHRRA